MTDPQRLYTEEEYLTLDAAAAEGVRYEYVDYLDASPPPPPRIVREGAVSEYAPTSYAPASE